MNKEYELILILEPNLLQEEALDVQNSITTSIESAVNKSEPVKRLLAQQNTQFYFAEISFFSPAQEIIEIEKKLKENKNIVRYMILAKKNRTKEKTKRSLSKKTLGKPSDQAPRKKVNLGDIDKKIDEILSE